MTCTHDWKFICAFGEDAPGKSLDTISHCQECGAVKHDYAHGGGQTSPNYPTIHEAASLAKKLALYGAARMVGFDGVWAEEHGSAWIVCGADWTDQRYVELGDSIEGLDHDLAVAKAHELSIVDAKAAARKK